MPLIKPKFIPGITKDETPLQEEGSWIDADKVRFYKGDPHVIGGWTKLPATLDPISNTVFDAGVFDAGVFREGASLTDQMFPGQVRGAHAWNDLTGSPYLAWGTTAGLFVLVKGIIYDITPDGFAPQTGVSRSYGSGPYGSNTYGGSVEVIWCLDNWGQNLLSVPSGGTLYEWTPGTPKALPVANAPSIITCMFVSPERIVILFGTSEFGGTVFNPMLVRWSDQGDNTAWTPAPTNLAGEFPLSHGANAVSGLVTRSQNLLWTDTSLYTMQFTGDVSSVFAIRVVGNNCGIISHDAKVASDSAVFWMSRDNFFTFTGQVPQVVPCPMRQDIFEHIFPGKEAFVHAGWNTGYSEPWFFWPDKRDLTGNVSRYAAMAPEGAWFSGFMDRTAWLSAGIFPLPIAFSTNRNIYQHEIPDGGDDGAPMPAFIESGFIDVGDGDTLYVIKRFVPDFHDQNPNIKVTLKTRMWPNEASVSRGPFTITPTTLKSDMRVKAREIAIRFDSSGIPAQWGLGAIAFDAQQSNEKR